MVSPKVWQRSRVQRSAHQLHWQQGAAAATAPARTHTPHTPAAPFLQNKLFGGLGLVGSALQLFEGLELWDNLIVCYQLLDKRVQVSGC